MHVHEHVHITCMFLFTMRAMHVHTCMSMSANIIHVTVHVRTHATRLYLQLLQDGCEESVVHYPVQPRGLLQEQSKTSQWEGRRGGGGVREGRVRERRKRGKVAFTNPPT